MATELGALFLIGVAYLSVLFAIAWLTDRNLIPTHLASHPLVYTLALGIFAGSWSFFGMTAIASRYGYGYLGYFIGTGALFLFAPLFLVPLLRLCRRLQFTSLVDLLAYRYRGARVGAIVTLVMLVCALPLVGVQIRIVSQVAELLSNTRHDHAGHGNLGLIFSAAIAGFAILFGARPISDRERHNGLIVAMAFESLVKLAAFWTVALLSVGAVFGGLDGMHAWLVANPALTDSLQRAAAGGSGHAMTILFLMAATGLPHLLHMALNENPSARAIRHASWGFPLLMLALSLPVLPVLWSGMRLGLDMPEEFFGAGVALQTRTPGIALAAFIGGVSAASSTIIVVSLALASMCMNNLVLPFYRPGAGSDLYRSLALIRSVLIAVLIFAAYFFSVTVASRTSLETLAMAAFVAAAQFFPGTVALLYWTSATRAGFLAGLTAGFAIWLLAVIDPHPGSPWASLTAMLPFAIEGNPWAGAAINSVLFNACVLFVFSLLGSRDPEEREAASACSVSSIAGFARHPMNFRSPGELVAALRPALGDDGATREVERALQDLGLDRNDARPIAMRKLRDRIESNLSRLVGAAVAMDVVNRSLPYERENTGSVADDIYVVDARLDDYRRDLRGLAAELDALRRFYRDTLQQLPVGVCGINAAGEIVLWNQAVERATGIAADEVIGSTLEALPEPWRQLLLGFLSSGDAQQPPSRIEKEGQSRWISLQKAEADEGAAEGSIDARFLLLEDVTENQLLQDELFHSERLASIGRLAAGVAHEIGNPVTGIDCLAQNLLAESGDEDTRDSARQILRQTQRIANIVSTLMNFSHQGLHSDKAPEWIPLSARVDEAIYLLGLDRGAIGVHYLNEVPGQVEVLGDGQKLLQVFVNLLSNARDASTNESRVLIRASGEPPELVVEVIDEGCGISEEYIDKVFEPFFTTKPAGRGTGLGLALVYSIITEMGGSVTARSPASEGMSDGTRIIIRLPTYRES